MPFWILLFILGAAVGSFLNVVSLRYDPEKFIFGKQLFGRSSCPNCRRTLRWFELIPIFSFIFLRGRCCSCGARISRQYPVVETLSGLVFIFVPLALERQQLLSITTNYYLLAALWVFVFIAILLVAVVDLRLRLIPDEANVIILVLGIALVFLGKADSWQGTFIGHYAMLFGAQDNIWINRMLAVGFAAALFGFLITVTNGRGMGMGDLKLAVPLAVVFGWPDVLMVAGLAFIFGSLAGGYILLSRRGTLKSAVPFGPFLVLASAAVFFFGKNILDWYFGFFRG